MSAHGRCSFFYIKAQNITVLKVRLKTYRMKMHIIYYSHVFWEEEG